ncbi:MAG TPA: rhodanese-like domain-containing protein [Caldithrix abyssi]|uniref:Rhodanese-like domain-containing protein n=1 Tax=Caldithrix abyssi TaxID=187145 RepID=A0A7V4WW33_CALAY|nr:rhodanese-like domain-containing protein [Caldithrix abyssi]
MDFADYLKSFDYRERRDMKIDIPTLLELYKKGRVQLIDVRFPEEVGAWQFGFAKNIPLNELPERLNEIDLSKLIVTVCPHYDRASMARHFLTIKGYRSKYLVEGLLGLAEYLRGDRAKNFMDHIKEEH